MIRGIRSAVAAIFALLAISGSGIAESASSDQPYKLAPGDRLTVTVVGQPELSGDFTVDSGGNITVPLLGAVLVDNMTIADSQQLIVDGLAKGLVNQPSVFVRIAEMRPIHVLGDVKIPGGYPYRYGSIIKTAVAQAGGYGTPEKSPGAVSEFLAADERVYVLSVTRDRLLIRKARLDAQFEGAKTFVFASRPLISSTDTEKIIGEEQTALNIQTESFEKQATLLRSQKPQLMAESESLERQIQSEKQQVELVQQQLDEYSKLSEKGLGRSSSTIELKLAQATKQSNVWRLEAERSRLQISIMDFDIKLQDAEALYKKQLLADLQDVRQRLAEVEATLPSAREIRASRLQMAGSAVNANPVYIIKITRVRHGEVSVNEATETTLLEPGDIVEVRTMRPTSVVLPGASIGSDPVTRVQ